MGYVPIKPFDFASLVATTLNSNMYLTALAKMDYMEINEKIAPYPDKDQTAKDQ